MRKLIAYLFYAIQMRMSRTFSKNTQINYAKDANGLLVQRRTDMKFGEKLQKARKEKGMTQAELAKKAGLGLKTITNYESGATYPHKREVYGTLAAILGIDADYLHNENDEFVGAAMARYGARGRDQAQALIEDVTGLFAGGDLAEDDMDTFMKAVQDAYWQAKEKNKKYSHKK